jgi:hypothetical protein
MFYFFIQINIIQEVYETFQDTILDLLKKNQYFSNFILEKINFDSFKTFIDKNFN